MQRQFRERPSWDYFIGNVEDENEHLVKEFYTNVSHIKKGTTVTKVQNLKVKFDGKTINEYLGFLEEDETLYLEKVALGEDARPWLAEYLAIPCTTPIWLTVGVKILRRTLNFEAKGWETLCVQQDRPHHSRELSSYLPVYIGGVYHGGVPDQHQEYYVQGDYTVGE